MSSGDTVRGWRGLLSRLGSARQTEGARPDAGPPPTPDDGTIVTSKGLQKFLSHLGTRPAPVLLDLGLVVGSNVTFFGEHLNCKFFVEDLFADLERHARDGQPEEFPAFLSKRFTLDAEHAWTACCCGTCTITWTGHLRRRSRRRSSG